MLQQWFQENADVRKRFGASLLPLFNSGLTRVLVARGIIELFPLPEYSREFSEDGQSNHGNNAECPIRLETIFNLKHLSNAWCDAIMKQNLKNKTSQYIPIEEK
ncbi:hypothetical protein AVEN_98046-1 [Araneus ventricosus]|uniref:Uncharacterized protein n=1 Tax=Araneus ventricosus TaxID=182803 RepID=A0A4Y2G3A1_ARAVE|nr:hypothetical protein AVEN_98046-1 [Araneus ventricosus]